MLCHRQNIWSILELPLASRVTYMLMASEKCLGQKDWAEQTKSLHNGYYEDIIYYKTLFIDTVSLNFVLTQLI